MRLFDISLRPFEDKKDKRILENWRMEFDSESMLLLPHGYEGRSVETAVAVAGDKRILGSLTGNQAIILGPFLHNPTAGSSEILQSLFALCRHMEVRGMQGGAVESYMDIPNDLPEYQKLVEKCGFVEVPTSDRKIYRRQFFEKIEEKK